MQHATSLGTDSEDPPKIGIPYRISSEEQAGDWEQIRPYIEAVEAAGGKAEVISLFLSADELVRKARELDGILLPGSPADVDPAHYGEPRNAKTNSADQRLEQTDVALLEKAFETGKPVLSICYGTQALNVFCGGTLVQDVGSELETKIEHRWKNAKGAREPFHDVRFEPGSELARLAGTTQTIVNSSHHQAVRQAGRGLRVTAKAPDGVVEAVELDSKTHWVVGVQWHPERQRASGDPGGELARTLFRELVRAARAARTNARQPESRGR